MENTKDQYIGTEIHSARSVNPDGETVTLDGETVVWTGEEDVLTPEELEEFHRDAIKLMEKANSKKRLPFGDKGAIIYKRNNRPTRWVDQNKLSSKDHPSTGQSFGWFCCIKLLEMIRE